MPTSPRVTQRCFSVVAALTVVAMPALAQDRPMSDQDKRLNFLNTTLIPTVPKDFEGALQALRDFIEFEPTTIQFAKLNAEIDIPDLYHSQFKIDIITQDFRNEAFNIYDGGHWNP